MHTERSWPTRTDDQRIPLIIVAGITETHAHTAAKAIRKLDVAGTVLVHHDLRGITNATVRRHLIHGGAEVVSTLNLTHGCGACTLREDLLPLLRRLSRKPDVARIVVWLAPALEPESICSAIQDVLVDGRTVDTDVRIEAVLTTVDLATWLTDATGDDTVAERGLSGCLGDERTVAQVAVGQVEFADALILTGQADDCWIAARTRAVIHRLTPKAPWVDEEDLDAADLLARIPHDARRGEIDGPHEPLLRGQPPLDTDAGVSLLLFEERRPFHPQRLHDAFEVLLDGVVRIRGRAWLATQPDTVLWLESAGGTLNIGQAGLWLASMPEGQWSGFQPHRQLKASLDWDDCYGDRAQELVVITNDAHPRDIFRALRGSLLTDDELAAGPCAWSTYPDPFRDSRAAPFDVPDDITSSANQDTGNIDNPRRHQ